jgi:hypothetical protein
MLAENLQISTITEIVNTPGRTNSSNFFKNSYLKKFESEFILTQIVKLSVEKNKWITEFDYDDVVEWISTYSNISFSPDEPLEILVRKEILQVRNNKYSCDTWQFMKFVRTYL